MKPDRLRDLLERAPQRGFVGLALDGVDVDAVIAAETDADLLDQAVDIAQRNSEPIWAEALARRACAVDDRPRLKLRLASVLAAAGQCDEANTLLAGTTEDADENLYRQVCGVLHAKAGRIEEAMALFEALPDTREGSYPAAIAISTAYEMLEQCDLGRATAFVARLAEAYPDHLVIRGFKLRCQLFAGHADEAAVLAQAPDYMLERAPAYDRRTFIEAVVELLDLPGRTNEAFDFLAVSIRKDPTHWSLYDRAANNARLAVRTAEYAELIAAIPAESRNTAGALAVLFQWHVDHYRFEEAHEILEALRPQSGRYFLQAQLYFALYAHAGDLARVEEAFNACIKCGISLAGVAVAYGLHQYYYNCSAATMRACLAKLDQSAGSMRTHVSYWQIYLRCLIAIGDHRRAIECYNALPAGLANGASLRLFGIYFDALEGRHQECAGRMDGLHPLDAPPVRQCISQVIRKPLRSNIRETPGAVLLFIHLYNGMDYIDWFLAHYRALGVDHFFVIDNGSDDGSRERLLKERDVSLFANSESFARSGIWRALDQPLDAAFRCGSLVLPCRYR